MIYGTRDDLIWLAGLLEGEGSFDLHRGRYPRIRVGMTDRDVVGRAASLMGSRIRMSLSTVGHKATFHAEISGVRAEVIMREILPYMGARRSSKIGEVLGRRVRATVEPLAGDLPDTLPGPALARPPGFAKGEAPPVSSGV